MHSQYKIQIIFLLFIFSTFCLAQNTFPQGAFLQKGESGSGGSTDYFSQDSTLHIFYKIEKASDSTYFILWGNDLQKYKSEKEFQYNPGNTSGFYPIKCNSKYIVAEMGCGTSCHEDIILFLNKNFIVEYFYALAFNLNQDLICYVDSESETIIVENIRTNRKKKIDLDDACTAALKYSCIESAFFNENKLTIKYNGSSWNNKNDDLRIVNILCDF